MATKFKAQSLSVLNWMTSKADGKSLAIVVFFSTVVAALVAHLFCWTNTLFGHDSLLIVQTDWFNQIAAGRPFQHLYLYLRGYIVAPWLIGVLGTVFLALSNIIICKILAIRSKGFIVAFCCIIATCPVITLINATYIHDYDVYMLSLLFSCISVYLCKTYKHGWIVGTLFLCLSMGLYPAYLQVVLVLIAGSFFTELLRNDNEFRIASCVKSILMIIVGALLYLVAVKCVQYFTDISALTGYNSSVSAFQFDDSLFHVLKESWLAPFSYLLFPETHMVRASGACNLLLMIVLVIVTAKTCRRNRLKKRRVALVTLLIVLMPLFANVIGFASGNNIHSLTILSYYLFYAILFACHDISSLAFVKCDKASPSGMHTRTTSGVGLAVGLLTLLLVLLMALSNAIYANQVYLKKALEYQATLSIMTGLEERLESIPGYIPGKTPVAFAGSLSNNPYFLDVRKGFPPSSDQATFSDQNGHYTKYSVGLGADISIYGFTQMNRYYEYILGRPIIMASVEGLSDSKKAPLESMPVYPVDGSIVFNEGVVLVKLS